MGRLELALEAARDRKSLDISIQATLSSLSPVVRLFKEEKHKTKHIKEYVRAWPASPLSLRRFLVETGTSCLVSGDSDGISSMDCCCTTGLSLLPHGTRQWKAGLEENKFAYSDLCVV